MWPLIIGIAVVAWIVYEHIDGKKIIYAEGTWLELKNPDDYTNIDSFLGPNPQYVRTGSNWTKSKSEDHWCFGAWVEFFEPNGKLDSGHANLEEYKPISDPVLVVRLEQKRNKFLLDKHNNNVKRIRDRREKALKLYLEG